MKQIVLDIETTGLKVERGDRIIEIACIEIRNLSISDNTFHAYISPQHKISEEAEKIHGLSEDFLRDKPEFPHIAPKLIDFIKGSELLIHNAPFDIGFLMQEFKLAGVGNFLQLCDCTVFDTLETARLLHPGLRNSLDALCERYHIDHAMREKHGAMTDSKLLAEVYFAMTSRQSHLDFEVARPLKSSDMTINQHGSGEELRPTVLKASSKELDIHKRFMKEFLTK